MNNFNLTKSCDNCYHYYQHYIKDGDTIRPVYCGHCTWSLRNKKKLVCEHWECVSAQKKERQQTIREPLENMSKRLDEITAIIKDDII